MRTTFFSTLAGLASLAVGQETINITESNSVNLSNSTGELGWGASGLSFGYSAGVGLNFSPGIVAGGFNAAIPGKSDGAIGSGYTVNETTVEIGIGAFLGNQSIDIAITEDKTTGTVTLVVNGKVVKL